jgi:YVTN family beta-propeller protein
MALALPLVLLTACRPHDFPEFPANYREFAYVTNGASGTVTVLDVVNVRVDREIPVGQNPVAVTASATRNEVYVVNSGLAGGQGSLTIINAENNSVAATIALRRQPVSIDLAAAGDLAYVANSGSNTVSVVDLEARREVAAIGAGEEPVAARISPDGKSLVVANRRGNSVSIFDAAARRVRAVFEGCPGAADVAILPDSSKAFAACSAGHQVMAIALARVKGDADAPTVQMDRLETMMDVGRAPVQLALKPDGGEIFVSNSLSDSISEISTPTNDVGGATLMGDQPMHGIVSRDNAYLYVSNFRSQEVAVYAIDEGRRVGSIDGGAIHVGDGPSAMAFSATGHLLFVVDTRSGDVAALRTSSRKLFTLLPAGRGPNAIAIKAFNAP